MGLQTIIPPCLYNMAVIKRCADVVMFILSFFRFLYKIILTKLNSRRIIADRQNKENMKEYKTYKIRKSTKYLNVALPVEWTQPLELKRGDVIHFNGKGDKLTITIEKKEIAK